MLCYFAFFYVCIWRLSHNIWTWFFCDVLYFGFTAHFSRFVLLIYHTLLHSLAASYTNGVFLTFSSKLTSKPSKANFETCVNTRLGSISNFDVDPVSTSNQCKNTKFVPLTRNMNCAITYIYIHGKFSCLWQINPQFKDKYIVSLRPILMNWQWGWQVLRGSLFNLLLNKFGPSRCSAEVIMGWLSWLKILESSWALDVHWFDYFDLDQVPSLTKMGD